MVNVKVFYENTLRRFAVSENSWSELESKIHSLFSIPPNAEISLSYIDEDNDVITLSTDIEFREVFSQKIEKSIKFDLTVIETNDKDVSTSQLTDLQQVNNQDDDEADGINAGSEWLRERVVSVEQSENTGYRKDTDNNMDISMILGSTQMQVDDHSVLKNQQSFTLESGKDDVSEDEDDLYVTEKDSESQQHNDNSLRYLEYLDQFNKLVEQSQDVLTKYPQILETINQIMKEIIRTVPENTENFSQWINSFRPPTLNSPTAQSTDDITNTYRSDKRGTSSEDPTLILNSSSNLDLPPIRSFTDFTQVRLPRTFSPFIVQNNPPGPVHPVSNPETSSCSIFNTSALTFNTQNLSDIDVQTRSDSLNSSLSDDATTDRFPFDNPFDPLATHNNSFFSFNSNPMTPQNQTTTINVSSTNSFCTSHFHHDQSNIVSQTPDNPGTPGKSVSTSSEIDYDSQLNQNKATLILMGFVDEKKNEDLLRECGGKLDVVIDRLLSVDR